MNAASEPQPVGLHPEVVDALTQLEAAVTTMAKVTDPDHDLLGDQPLVIMEFARRFESLRRQLSAVDHQLITLCDRHQVADRLSQSSTASLLANGLQLSAGDAARRVRAARALTHRMTLLGAPLDPIRPHLARAVAAGTVSGENADIVIRSLDTMSRIPGVDPDHVDTAEQDLTQHATLLRPEDLRAAGVRMIECYDPDGQPERERRAEALRELRLITHRDGGYSITGRLTGTLGAQLFALLSPLARPRPADPAEPAEPAPTQDTGPHEVIEPVTDARRSARPQKTGVPDDRTPGQRWHDALADLVGRLARAGGLPDSGGVPATLIVTIGARDLLQGTGHGTTTDGTQISAEQVLRIADEALILPAVLTHTGAVLTLGRTCRIANRPQTMALVARDGGCSFPTCRHPPQWCQRHHVRAWIDGGPTDVDNLTLLCGYHHRTFEQRGWSCIMIGDLPHWVPPRWIDPARTPMLHHRIQQLRDARRTPRRPRVPPHPTLR